MITEVIFDTETQTFFDEIEGDNPGDLKVSVVSAYTRTLDNDLIEKEGRLLSFWENEIGGLWELFQSANRIIGFNSVRFDVPVLQPYSPIPLSKFTHFDIMMKIKEALGHRLSLNALAKETLGREKTEDGAMGVLLWKRGDKDSLERLKRYCETDVMITKDIYDFGLKNNFLRYKDKWNTPRQVEIDFSYPKEEIGIKQEGLF